MSNGQYPKAGPPCAFACHWDGAKPAGQGNDLWTMARKNNIQMRFDLVKTAVNLVINEMQAKASGNLSIGIFTFDTAPNRVYPVSGEAGSDWVTALAAVGTPPVFPAVLDTGIQPSVAQRTGNNNNSYFAKAMSTLATQYVTTSGNGNTAATPRKSLFIVTDGFQDDTARQAMQYSVCKQFKDMGYAVYVIYTPYYPVMHIAYFQSNWAAIVEGHGPDLDQLQSPGLRQCTSRLSVRRRRPDIGCRNADISGKSNDSPCASDKIAIPKAPTISARQDLRMPDQRAVAETLCPHRLDGTRVASASDRPVSPGNAATWSTFRTRGGNASPNSPE